MNMQRRRYLFYHDTGETENLKFSGCLFIFLYPDVSEHNLEAAVIENITFCSFLVSGDAIRLVTEIF